MKVAMFLILTLGAKISLFSQTFTVSNINYSLTSPTTVKVGTHPTSFTGAAEILYRVSYNNNVYLVSSIGDDAFANCTGLTSVKIPNSINFIGKDAFNNCSGLVSVNIPTSVTTIDDMSFFNCINLISVNIPISVTKIGVSAFGRCKSLTSINIPNSVKKIANGTFSGCETLTSIIIPNSISTIGDAAFYRCTNLTTVTIPNSVEQIGNFVFSDCINITSVTVDWEIPLHINASVFDKVPVTSATLYVPSCNLKAYQVATCWKDFNMITARSLPLTLTSLTAKTMPTGNQINWTTENIINVKNIILERSGANRSFTTVAIFPATTLQYIDYYPLPGDNYYRISTTDNDGTITNYSLTTFAKGLNDEVSFYPNPITNGVLNVKAGDAKIQTIALYDLNGRKVILVNTNNNSKNLIVQTQGLPKGAYVLVIKDEKSATTKKVMVN